MRRSILEGDLKALGFQEEVEELLLEQLSFYPQVMSPEDKAHFCAFLGKVQAVLMAKVGVILQRDRELSLLSQEIDQLREEAREYLAKRQTKQSV